MLFFDWEAGFRFTPVEAGLRFTCFAHGHDAGGLGTPAIGATGTAAGATCGDEMAGGDGAGACGDKGADGSSETSGLRIGLRGVSMATQIGFVPDSQACTI